MRRRTLLLIVGFGLAALACNLTSSDPPPPTLVPGGPIAAATQATLGYVPLPAGAANGTAIAMRPSIEIELFSLVNQVESDRLMMHIDALVGFHTRHINSSTTALNEGIGAAYNYIEQQLLAIQAVAPDLVVIPGGIYFTAHYNEKTSLQRNAFAYLPGTEAGGDVIVIGAHYDSRTDDLDDAESAAPGADDNGSGVAVLLELARLLSRRPHRSSIIFVFFAAEEEGRQGSQAFVTDYIQYYEIPVFAMINLDTIGSWNGPDGTVNNRDIRVFSAAPNDSGARQLARMMEFYSTHYALALNILVQDRMDREGRYGDHQSFTESGYPAIRFIEALEDTVNRDARDTISGVEIAYLVDATKTILGVVTALADGPRPPRNISLRNNGDGTQSLVWEPVQDANRYVVALRRPNSLIYDHHFITVDATSGAWDRWSQYEAVAIAAEDANGLVGPFSKEYKIP